MIVIGIDPSLTCTAVVKSDAPAEVRFVIPSVAVAQPRQRHRVIHSDGRSFASNYTPTDSPVNAFKAAAQVAASQAYQGEPLTGPLVMHVLFVMPRPKSKMTGAWKKAGKPRTPHTGKPDRDNLMKSLQDALNGLVYVDDSQIWDGRVVKCIAGDEQAHVEVVVQVKEAGL